jgi:hypothetical protein
VPAIRDLRADRSGDVLVARLPHTQGSRLPAHLRWGSHHRQLEGLTVKKLLVLALLGLGVFAVWRKVQADRAEIDLWTEATTGELN